VDNKKGSFAFSIARRFKMFSLACPNEHNLAPVLQGLSCQTTNIISFQMANINTVRHCLPAMGSEKERMGLAFENKVHIPRLRKRSSCSLCLLYSIIQHSKYLI
jgi:hypothetical protein